MKSYPTKEKPSALTPPSHQRKSQSKVSLPDNRKFSHSGLVQMANQGKHTLQLKALEAMFNSSQAIQKQGLEEEELLQGKFDILQKMSIEEEEPIQGKFETAQREGIEDEELLQGKFDTLQKMSLEEEEPLQGKFETAQREGIEEEELLQGKFETIQKQENNTGLPDNLKSGIEHLSGYSMDDVKVHYNSPKPATLQAHAYAQGTNIHLASGQEKHLPHEAWHVVQQKQGRVKPTMQMKGKVNINDDAALEKEADVMGTKALQMKPKENKSNVVTNSVTQKRTNMKKDFGFMDNRPEAVPQRKLQEMADNSSVLQREKLKKNQLEGMANFLARRSGISDPKMIREDIKKWIDKGTDHTGESQSTRKDIRAAVPGGGNLKRIVKRHQKLTETGRLDADEGAPISEMRGGIHNTVPQNMKEGRALSSELAAFAEVMSSDYSRVERFTDGTETGNLSYKGKQSDERTNFRPFKEERLTSLKYAEQASKHMSGDTDGSPYVSTTAHASSALKTTDDQLQNIIYGSPGRKGAPFIESFMVPSHGLFRADQVEGSLRKGVNDIEYGMKHSQTMKLAKGEHEELFRNDKLDDYSIGKRANPYASWLMDNRELIKSKNEDEE